MQGFVFRLFTAGLSPLMFIVRTQLCVAEQTGTNLPPAPRFDFTEHVACVKETDILC